MDSRKAIFFVAACFALTSNSLAWAQGDLSQGSGLAQELCAQCHAVEAGRTQSPNPEAPAFEELANSPGMNALAIRIFLQTPHRSMPLFVLEGEEIENVSAYLMSLEQPAQRGEN